MTAPLNKGEEERAEFRNEIEDKGNWIEVFRRKGKTGKHGKVRVNGRQSLRVEPLRRGICLTRRRT